jgi:hypothetical protein
VGSSSDRGHARQLTMEMENALLCGSVLKQEGVERAMKIATEEIEVRKALGDY